ncbi:hypothetical protein BHE74_00017602, partial [Ensete ventricosum]
PSGGDHEELRGKIEDVQGSTMEEREEQDQGCVQVAVPSDTGTAVGIGGGYGNLGPSRRRKTDCEIREGCCGCALLPYYVSSLEVLQGSTRAGLLGEATVNLADYVEVIKASSVSFHLKTEAILHVSISS